MGFAVKFKDNKSPINMWSCLVFPLIVGLTIAATNPAWKDNAEYNYKVQGRTLASLHEVSDQYSGIFYNANLKIQPRNDGRLQVQISDARYSQIHSELYEGWKTYIPETELSWKPLELSSKPFQIEMKQGRITNLIVSKDIANWEANIIKSIVSQFQINTSFNQERYESPPSSAVFVTNEDTVTGNVETLYRINTMPENTLPTDYWHQSLLELKGDGDVIEVVKYKNYSESIELPSYFYGFGALEVGYPATNKMGYFLVRNSVTRALLTGNLKRYTIQHTTTVNEIQVSPTLANKQKGSVVSMVNVTLQAIKSVEQRIENVPNPQRLGNLVYSYDRPLFKVYEKQPYNMQNAYNNRHQKLHDSEESYKHQHPQIQEDPESPLLPFTMGYKGVPIKQTVDIVKSVVHLAKEIGEDLQDSYKVLLHNTLNKFTTLSALIRIMDSEEIEGAASKLYNNHEEGPNQDAWQVFRDSVAECGTGPAFVTIKNWIKSRKIQGVAATIVLATMSKAVRQPTPQYMKSFFELVQNQALQSQWPLNDTAFLSYSTLVNKVYVINKMSRKQYPIKSFVDFNNEDGAKFVRESVIPYYSRELQDAISQGQIHRIHVFIRCLGNIGHPSILSAYEPYLEGRKQISQYQRVLMVLSMDKLAEDFPEEAASVLLKLYQNTGESQEVRVVAFYQLMRTRPQAELLQYMASYTNIDKAEHVNAAVKSTIEAVAELEEPELQSWRRAAQAVIPLLTKKNYGIQYGANYIHDRFVEELKISYKENIQFIGSEDSFIPKGFKYSLHTNVGGVNQRVVNIQTMISSIGELVHVFKKQTEYYSKQYQEQKQHYDQQKQNLYSSQKIASLLNMQPEELEQMEACLYMELGASSCMLSFDNTTMNKLPEKIRKIEEQLKHGKKINFVKIVNDKEMALSFPTESGFPFLFTYDTPLAMKLQGSVQAFANPQISQGDKLHTPESLQLKSNLTFSLTYRLQSHISFITPFDHQQYIAGFDKVVHMHMPIQSDIRLNVQSMQGKIEITPVINQHKSILHYSTWPYTSRVDIKNFQPVSLQSSTHGFNQKNLHNYEKVFGERETGVAMRIQIQHKRQSLNFLLLKDVYSKHGAFAVLKGLWDDASIHYSWFNVDFLPKLSTTHKITLQFGYHHDYSSNSKSDKIFTFFATQQQRQQTITNKVSFGIHNVATRVIDTEIKFQGNKNIDYLITAAFAKSNVDPKSRFLVYFRKNASVESFEVSLDAQNEVYNTNELDPEYSMWIKPKAKSKIEVIYGPTLQLASNLTAHFQFSRSDDRKQYLKELPMYKQCEHEMYKGNKHLPSCANITMEANLLDRIDIKLQLAKLPPQVEQVIKTIFHTLRFNYYLVSEIDTQQKTSLNEINMKVSFDPDLRGVNVTVTTPEEQTTFHNVEVSEYAKEIFVLHPVFHLGSRLISKILELPYYRTFSVIDKTQISTFNSKIYPAHISRHWAVMLLYLPKETRHYDSSFTVEQQLEFQPEQYIILVRQNEKDTQMKDVKIVLSSPQTEYRVVEITMQANKSGQFWQPVTVDDQFISISDQESYDYKDGYIQIYGLFNREVKVEIRDAFYVIYDGRRLVLRVAENKFRNSVRGFSGQYNNEPTEEFCTPHGYVTSNWYKFFKSYEIGSEEGEQVRQEFISKDQKKYVKKRRPLYTDVISDEAARHSEYAFQESSGNCTKYRTQYVEQNAEICFSIYEVPVCSNECQPRGTITKNVPVHCIQKNSVAELWRNQIDRGANPDFSHKKESKTISMQLPQRCSV